MSQDPPSPPPPQTKPPANLDDYTRTPRASSKSASPIPSPEPADAPHAPPPKSNPYAKRTPSPDRATYAQPPKDRRATKSDDRKKDKDDDHEPSFWDRTIGKRIDGLVPDLIKRTLTGTFGALFMSEDGLRQTLSDLKMPKELIQHILQQADHTKRELMQTIARELREFLEVSNFYEEVQRILTSLSFEIRTQIRLVPNDEAFVKPDIKNKVSVHMDSPDPDAPPPPPKNPRSSKNPRSAPPPSSPPPEPYGHDDDPILDDDL